MLRQTIEVDGVGAMDDDREYSNRVGYSPLHSMLPRAIFVAGKLLSGLK